MGLESIGNMLGVNTFDSQSFDWKSLNKVHDGTYNMGEVTSSFKNGKITFDKVNNHISKSNNKVVSGSDNKRTNAAVFMSILTTYGLDTSNAAKFNEKISTFMTTNVDKVDDAIFDDIKNPFVKEAFNFLLKDELGGARPLSRDELHVLFELLKKGIGGEEGVYADVDVEAGMQRLQNLRKLKAGELQEGSEERTNALSDLKGMKVENISASKKSRLESVSVSQTTAVKYYKPIVGAKGLSMAATEFLNREFEDYSNFYAEKSEVGGPDRNDVCQYILKKATDPKFQQKVNALLGDYCNPVQLDDVNEVEMHPCTKKTFSTVTPEKDEEGKIPAYATNSGSNGFEQLAKQGKKAIVQVAADTTFFSGTFWYSGQEEGHCRDMSPVMFAILIAKGYIEPVKDGGETKFRYALNEQGEPKLNPWKGYYIKGFKNATDFKPNEDGSVHAVTYLFTAGTSFGTGINCDKNGFRQIVYEVYKNRTDIFPKGDNTRKAEMFARLGRFHDVLRHWTDRIGEDASFSNALKAKESLLGRPLTEKEREDVEAEVIKVAITKAETSKKRPLTEKERAKVVSTMKRKRLTKEEEEKFGFLREDAAFGYGKTKFKCTKFSEMMRIAMLAESTEFNVFGENPEEEADRLLELMRKENYKEILDKATERFHELQNSQNQGWIKLALAAAEETGATAVQTCNVGGGYFYNAVDDFPESWTSNWAVFGSDKELIMNVYDANAAEEVPTWESNINTAMAKQTEKVD